jgi:hypothetical protein
MNTETLIALRGSIAKWEGIVAGTMVDEGRHNCPLCQKFNKDLRKEEGGNYGTCEGCPVAAATGSPLCDQSPYEAYADAILGEDDLSAEELTALAQAELDFLKSLLPRANTSVTDDAPLDPSAGDTLLRAETPAPAAFPDPRAMPPQAGEHSAPAGECRDEASASDAERAPAQALTTQVPLASADEELIPCDVAVAPATVFGAGCSLSLVLAAIRRHQKAQPAPHFRRSVLKRVIPEVCLAPVAERMRFLAGTLPDLKPEKEALLDGAQENEHLEHRLTEIHALLTEMLAPRDPFIRIRVDQWLRGLSQDEVIVPTIGPHPGHGRLIYGYCVKGMFVVDPRVSPCCGLPCNPHVAYGLTPEQVATLERMNERLTRGADGVGTTRNVTRIHPRATGRGRGRLL